MVPFPCDLEALLGQVKASQLLFHLSEQEEVCWRQFRRIRGGWEVAGSPWRPASFDNGGGGDGCVVPMEKPVSLRHLRPLLPQVNHELAEDHQDGVGVDGGPLRNDVGVDQALAVKEGQQHLFCPAGMDFGLDGAWLAFFDPLL